MCWWWSETSHTQEVSRLYSFWFNWEVLYQPAQVAPNCSFNIATLHPWHVVQSILWYLMDAPHEQSRGKSERHAFTNYLNPLEVTKALKRKKQEKWILWAQNGFNLIQSFLLSTSAYQASHAKTMPSEPAVYNDFLNKTRVVRKGQRMAPVDNFQASCKSDRSSMAAKS